jgi:hypothetical protein
VQNEPQVGDFVVMFDTESEEAGEPPILLVLVTDTGFRGVGEGSLEDADALEAKLKFLAHQLGTQAWRHVNGHYVLLPPYTSRRNVH